MAIYKRGRVYWFHFNYGGRRIQMSTHCRNAQAAGDIEAAYRVKLAKGEAGVARREAPPSLTNFAPRFLSEIHTRRADKPATIEFYECKLKALLAYSPLANTRLDCIDEALIDRFIQWKSRKCKPATVNRCLATLRRMLRLAAKWKVCDRVPCFELLDGEGERDFTLGRDVQQLYVARCPQPLKAVAQFSLETGFRIGEVLALQWADVSFAPVGKARRGFVRIRKGKSRKAKRTLSLTIAARDVLALQAAESKSEFVFVRNDHVSPLSRFTLAHQHARVRKEMGMDVNFVIHSFRHTMLTRLGEAGVDAFTIMRIAGHSTITVSQRYVHPTAETIERAFDTFEAFSVTKESALATKVATAESIEMVGVQ